MAAVVRGRAQGSARQGRASQAAFAKPRSAARAKAPKSKASGSGGYRPGKLNAASAVALSPRLAGLAAGVVVMVGVVAAAVTGERPQQINAALRDGFAADMAWLGFKVQRVHVAGAGAMAQDDILAATGIYKNQPIFGLDPEHLRHQVETVGWVKQARVVRLLPDTLVIAVTPRPTLAVWQDNDRLHVIDNEGRVIAEADPSHFPYLPLVVGDGANEAAGALMPMLQSRPRLMRRVEALVRVDGRRWDLRLKDGSLIQLPAAGEESALIQLDQLDQRERLLDLGFERIDLRDSETIAVRPRQQAATAPNAASGGQ